MDVPAAGQYLHIHAAGMQEAWCAGIVEDDEENTGVCPAVGQQLDEISVAGTANGSCLSFFAYLRMLVVFLHSLEGRSES